MDNRPNMDCFTIEGMYYPNETVSESIIREVLAFRPKKGDIFLSTSPKCGNHWVKYMIWTIIHDSSPLPEQVEMDYKLFPFLELTGLRPVEGVMPPRTMSLHLPYRLVPKSAEAKYVTVVRNIFDVVVSFYHHISQLFIHDFDTNFRLFVEGKLPFGDYFDTTQGWYERRNDPNVLFLVYEDLVQDHEGAVRQIAAFLGNEYRDKLEKGPEILESVIHKTSFDYMKKNAPMRHFKNVNSGRKIQEMVLSGTGAIEEAFDLKSQVNVYYKGKVGTGVEVLNAEHRRILENLVDEKIKYPELAKILKRTKM